MNLRWIYLVAIAALFACGKQEATTGSSAPVSSTTVSTQLAEAEQPAPKWFSDQQVTQGAKIYAANCVACHGEGARGDPSWRNRGADGKFPPPPLNGSGHAWHHPLAQLRHIITNGNPPNLGNMRGWGDKLSAEEIEAVMAWFQAQWPEEIYQHWSEIDQRASATLGGSDG